jgi:hypothetical protein
VNALARVALVGVVAKILALCDAKRVGGDNLVEGVRGAGEDFTGVAVAVAYQYNIIATPNLISQQIKYRTSKDLPQNVSLLVTRQLRRPLRVSAMAFSVVARHIF